MMFLQNTNLFSLVTFALTILFLTGCGSDSDHDDHDETPVGLVLSINGTDIAMQEETTVTYTSGDHIELNQGETLGPVLVEFIAEDGDRFLPHSDEGYSLQYSAANSNMLALGPVTGENEWTIQLTGNVTGDTTIRFELMHNGHADFESRPFQVRVVSLQNEE